VTDLVHGVSTNASLFAHPRPPPFVAFVVPCSLLAVCFNHVAPSQIKIVFQSSVCFSQAENKLPSRAVVRCATKFEINKHKRASEVTRNYSSSCSRYAFIAAGSSVSCYAIYGPSNRTTFQAQIQRCYQQALLPRLPNSDTEKVEPRSGTRPKCVGGEADRSPNPTDPNRVTGGGKVQWRVFSLMSAAANGGSFARGTCAFQKAVWHLEWHRLA